MNRCKYCGKICHWIWTFWDYELDKLVSDDYRMPDGSTEGLLHWTMNHNSCIKKYGVRSGQH